MTPEKRARRKIIKNLGAAFYSLGKANVDPMFAWIIDQLIRRFEEDEMEAKKMSAKEYSVFELTSPGVRMPIRYTRVLATAQRLEEEMLDKSSLVLERRLLAQAIQQLVSTAAWPSIGATQEQKDEMLARYLEALDNAEKLLSTMVRNDVA